MKILIKIILHIFSNKLELIIIMCGSPTIFLRDTV